MSMLRGGESMDDFLRRFGKLKWFAYSFQIALCTISLANTEDLHEIFVNLHLLV